MQTKVLRILLAEILNIKDQSNDLISSDQAFDDEFAICYMSIINSILILTLMSYHLNPTPPSVFWLWSLQYWSEGSQILVHFIFYGNNVSSECSRPKGCPRKKLECGGTWMIICVKSTRLEQITYLLFLSESIETSDRSVMIR